MIKRIWQYFFGPKPGPYFQGRPCTIVGIEATDYNEKNIYLIRYEDGKEDTVHENLIIYK